MPLSKPIKVMVVEDNAIEALNAQAALEADGMDVVGIAATAQEAIELAKMFRPDLALVDISLGGRDDGVQLASALCRDHGMYVLFVSGHFDEHRAEIASVKHALGFIIKPFSREQLQMALRLSLPELRRSAS